jgi:hypothetical protein
MLVAEGEDAERQDKALLRELESSIIKMQDTLKILLLNTPFKSIIGMIDHLVGE